MRNNEMLEIEKGPYFSVGLSLSFNLLYNRFVGVMQFRFNKYENFIGALEKANFKVLFNEKMAEFIKFNARLKEFKFEPAKPRIDYKNLMVSVSFEEVFN